MATDSGIGFAPGQVLSGPVDLRLSTTAVGREVHYRERVDSTNAVLRALAGGGAPEGTVVLAEEQTAGRGRGGRAWHSPPGVGLWLSVLLRPGRSARELSPLSIVTALSIAGALRSDFGVEAKVKWPNDLLGGGAGPWSERVTGRKWCAAAGRKLGGILLEYAQDAGGPAGQLVVGIGLNVNQEESDLAIEVAPTAVSMRMLLGRPVDRLEVLRSLLEGLEADWGRFDREGLAGFVERWRRLSATLGRRIAVASDSGNVEGIVVDLSLDGALVVEDVDGRRVEVWHGDVTALV